MTFNIYQLDKIHSDSSQAETALEKYQEALLERFSTSPEGQERRQADPEMGFWAGQLIYYGYAYLGITLPRLTDNDVQEIVTKLFPRKISLFSPDEADDAIPELLAFWRYLKREYDLPQADLILNFLGQIEPSFKSIMNDPANFGMAKSFIMGGQSAGFDMTNDAEAHQFIRQYNANLLAQNPDLEPSLAEDRLLGMIPDRPSVSQPKKSRPEKKKRRKMAKASRRKNRK